MKWLVLTQDIYSYNGNRIHPRVQMHKDMFKINLHVAETVVFFLDIDNNENIINNEQKHISALGQFYTLTIGQFFSTR